MPAARPLHVVGCGAEQATARQCAPIGLGLGPLGQNPHAKRVATIGQDPLIAPPLTMGRPGTGPKGPIAMKGGGIIIPGGGGIIMPAGGGAQRGGTSWGPRASLPFPRNAPASWSPGQRAALAARPARGAHLGACRTERSSRAATACPAPASRCPAEWGRAPAARSPPPPRLSLRLSPCNTPPLVVSSRRKPDLPILQRRCPRV